MNISQIRDDDSVTYIIKGKIDASMEEMLMKEMKLDGIKHLVFDLKDVDYIFSAGLRVLLQAQKTMNASGGTMKIVNAQDSVKEMFNIVGFNNIMDIE
ncbi:MAG: STAS domain-containing protein [Alphaproteobacteria bacterium]|nr:STAS domain-containing protein [Alphaproteobacteria bacterium]